MHFVLLNSCVPQFLHKNTVVGDYINTMKTTFDFNFDLYPGFKQPGYTIQINI